MNNKEFLNQKACDMTAEELLKAVKLKIKSKEEPKPKDDKYLTFAEEIQKYPERFERLISGFNWITVERSDGISRNGTTKILNSVWNYGGLNNKLLYVEYANSFNINTFKEIIRRKKNAKI